MKKFTKGCLTTALILFILGCLICGVFGLLGGFRQLENMNGIAGIPFVWHRGTDGDMEIGFFKYEDEDWEKEDWKKSETSGTKEKLTATVDTLRDIEIDVTDCSLLIMESEDDHVWISVSGDAQETYYSVEPYTTGKHMLSIRNTNHHHINWRTSHNDSICLYLPEGCELDSVVIELGAGLIESIPLKADVLDIDVGAGACEVSSLEGENVSLTVGAGGIEADVVRADTVNMEIGAGEIKIRDILAEEYASVDISMGSAEIEGTIAGNLDVECSMGTVQMKLTGAEDDHGYSVDCGMGEVKVGSRKCEGLASEKSWNEGKDSQFDIDCSMGSITINFDK